MTAKNPLRRFSARRRLRRREGSLDRSKTGKDRRVLLSVRTLVLPATVSRLAAVGKAFKLSRAKLVGTVLEWFAVQPKLIQGVVLSAAGRERLAISSERILQQLLAP
jgi:hypothetical protein